MPNRCWVVLLGALTVGGLGSCGSDEPERDEQGAIAEEGDLSVQSVEVGDCFNDPDGVEEGVEVEALGAVPCAEPHDNEAYHVFELPDGEYPGDAEVEEQSFEGCVGPFEGYVGRTYEASELEIFPITPTEASWNDVDDREVICAVYLPEQELTGSMRDSAR